jgi:porin
MSRLIHKFVILASTVLCVLVQTARSQTMQEGTLSGPDSHETGQGPHGHLFGDWDGERSRLLEHGVAFDLQYVSDSLWNIKSEQPERFASWNRFRGTIDINFGELYHEGGLYFHATALCKVEEILEHTLGYSAIRAVCLARIHFASIHGGSRNGG